MSDIPGLIATLKSELRANKVTYQNVAEALSMSEANVKRMFASQNMTLERVEQICRLVNIDLLELIQLYDAGKDRMMQLSKEQEQELVADTRLLLVAVSVRNHLGFEEILDNHYIGETELIQCLAKLDRLKIIDLLPNNKIRLRIDENFSWIPYGPIETFYEKTIQKEFMTGRFETNARLFSFGLLGESSISIIEKKLKALTHEFIQLVREDRKLPFDKRRSVAMLTAIRPWEFSILAPYVKQK